MLEWINLLQKGSRFKLRHLKMLGDAIRSCVVVGGPGVRVTRTGGSTIVSLAGIMEHKFNGFECIYLNEEYKSWYAKFAPGQVGTTGGRFVYPKIKEVSMEDVVNMEPVVIQEGAVWLGVQRDGGGVKEAIVAQKEEELMDYTERVLLGVFKKVEDVMKYTPYRTGVILLDEWCPFSVQFKPEESGNEPEFKVLPNGGRIVVFGLEEAPPWMSDDMDGEEGSFVKDGYNIDQAAKMSGKFAYLEAAFEVKVGVTEISFEFKGYPNAQKLWEVDDKGRAKKSRVLLAKYGGAQYVKTHLYMAPVFFGKGGYYVFAPFLYNPADA